MFLVVFGCYGILNTLTEIINLKENFSFLYMLRLILLCDLYVSLI